MPLHRSRHRVRAAGCLFFKRGLTTNAPRAATAGHSRRRATPEAPLFEKRSSGTHDHGGIRALHGALAPPAPGRPRVELRAPDRGCVSARGCQAPEKVADGPPRRARLADTRGRESSPGRLPRASAKRFAQIHSSLSSPPLPAAQISARSTTKRRPIRRRRSGTASCSRMAPTTSPRC